jgi:hypothetical protein
MILDTQSTIWLFLGIVPSLAVSRAWFEFLSAKLGGDDARDERLRQLALGRWRGEDVGFISLFLRSQPDPHLQSLQQRLRIRAVVLVVTAIGGWIVAGWLAGQFSIPNEGLRWLQIGLFSIVAAIQLRWLLTNGARWSPRPHLVASLVGSSILVILAIIGPRPN